jgi:two-component system OmpR family sensor kinase
LTAIRGAAELLRDEEAGPTMTPVERRRFLDHIIADTDRLTTLLGRLRDLAHAELPMAAGQTTIAAIAEELSRRFPQLRVVPAGHTAGPLALSLEAAVVIFNHLAENAAQHGATSLEITAVAHADRTSITIADNGTGISPGNRALVLQPFFTTRREQGGTGMGLDIARAMLTAHGGSIRLRDSVAGATFEIELPAAPA